MQLVFPCQRFADGGNDHFDRKISIGLVLQIIVFIFGYKKRISNIELRNSIFFICQIEKSEASGS